MATIIVQIPGKKVQIPKECPKCHGDRTSKYFFQGRSYQYGSVPVFVDQWECNCGHVDLYADLQDLPAVFEKTTLEIMGEKQELERLQDQDRPF
jgi:hypothetical protein